MRFRVDLGYVAEPEDRLATMGAVRKMGSSMFPFNEFVLQIRYLLSLGSTSKDPKS